jgi:hypothetical protein
MSLTFRIKYDDKNKLLPILNKFGEEPFTMYAVNESEICPDRVKSGDILRWDMGDIITKVGEVNLKNKYVRTVALWKLTERTVKCLKRKPRVYKK